MVQSVLLTVELPLMTQDSTSARMWTGGLPNCECTAHPRSYRARCMGGILFGTFSEHLIILDLPP